MPEICPLVVHRAAMHGQPCRVRGVTMNAFQRAPGKIRLAAEMRLDSGAICPPASSSILATTQISICIEVQTVVSLRRVEPRGL